MLTVLRRRDFRLLFVGQSLSTVGDALVMVAIALYVTRLTGNPSDVGRVLTSYAAPLVLFVLFGGVLADRLPRQKVMIASDVVRAVLHGTLAVLIATGAVRVWHMVVIGILFGCAEAFFRPAYTGLLPQTVPESDIQSAQALTGAAREVAEIVSPALATALVLGVGGAWAFGLDAATFVVSALLLLRVQARDRGGSTAPTSVVSELREGFHAVRERAWVWATIMAFSVALMTALAPFFVLGASIARDVYDSEAVFGFVNVAWGLGTVTGAIVGSRWKPLRPMRAGMTAAVPWPLAIALYGSGAPLPLVYIGMIAAGLGIGLFAVWWETALATRIPPQLLSRVSAWDWMGSLLLLPLGYLLTGPVAKAYGDVEVLVVGGLLGGLACALGLLPRSTRELTRLEEEPVDPPALTDLLPVGVDGADWRSA